MFIKSLHAIEAGSEVCENYGPTFYLKSRNARRAELSGRYWFDCTCHPCSKNWPLLEKLAADSEHTDSLENVDALMAAGNASKAVEELAKVLADFRKNSGLPSQTQIRAEDKLRTCIYNLGSFSVVEKPNK